MTTTITLQNGAYLVRFPYDPMTVQMLKNSVPSSGRKFDPALKTWQVHTQYESALRQVFPNATIPAASSAKIATVTRVIDLRYLGTVKDRGNDEYTAYGFADGGWTTVFSERTLRAWFEGLDDSPPGDTSTLYGILGLPRHATAEEIKTGFRRMARQWHPDVCNEPNAQETFLRIKEAYDILSNAKSKARYDVGLSFAQQQPQQRQIYQVVGYRAPLRCGLVLAEGFDCLGRFTVSKILGWEDIIENGRTLVSSWPMGADVPLEKWV